MKEITPLEKIIVEDIIRPSLSDTRNDHFHGHRTLAQDINFTKFIENTKNFYLRNGGNAVDWYRLLLEANH